MNNNNDNKQHEILRRNIEKEIIIKRIIKKTTQVNRCKAKYKNVSKGLFNWNKQM